MTTDGNSVCMCNNCYPSVFKLNGLTCPSLLSAHLLLNLMRCGYASSRHEKEGKMTRFVVTVAIINMNKTIASVAV